MSSIGKIYSLIDSIVRKNYEAKEALILCQNAIKEIDEVIQDPSKLSEKTSLLSYLAGEKGKSISKLDYLRIKSLPEGFDPLLIEQIPQIKETYDLLINVLNSRKTYYEERTSFYKELIDKDKLHISIFQDFNSIVSRYSPFKYIDEEELDRINRTYEILKSEYDINEEVTGWFRDLYLEIAKNNSTLERTMREGIIERRTREREQESLERLARSKEELRRRVSTEDENRKIADYLNSLKNTDYFEKIEQIKDAVNPLVYSRLVIIGEQFKSCINAYLSDTILRDIIGFKETLYDENSDMITTLEEFSDVIKEELTPIVMVRKILDIINNGRIDELADNLNDTKIIQSRIIKDTDTFAKFFNVEDYKNILNECDRYIDEELLKKDYDKIIKVNRSLNYGSVTDRNQLYEDSNISKQSVLQHQLFQKLIDLKYLISVADLQDLEEREEVDECYRIVEIRLKELKEHLVSIGEITEDEKTLEEKFNSNKINPYSEHFENYIIFLDPVDMKVTENKYIELEKSEIGTKLAFMIKTDLPTLLRGGKKHAISKPINIRRGVSNPDNIRELKAGGKESRIGFKVADTTFEGKNVVLAITVSRGKVGENEKNAGLKRNLTIFKEKNDYYKKIVEYFEKYKNLEEIEDEKEKKEVKDFVENLVLEGLKVYNYFNDNNNGDDLNNTDIKKRGGRQ